MKIIRISDTEPKVFDRPEDYHKQAYPGLFASPPVIIMAGEGYVFTANWGSKINWLHHGRIIILEASRLAMSADNDGCSIFVNRKDREIRL